MLESSMDNIISALSVMKPKPSPKPLIKLGGRGDGAYLLPDDFEGITACFSPGVSNRKHFEDELTKKYGMQCHLCDKSSDEEKLATPLVAGLQTFKKKWLDVNGAEDSISLEDWVNELAPDAGDDLLLQMDIEGAEYRNILQTPEYILNRFRIVVVEVHGLVAAKDPAAFEKNVGPFLRKLGSLFECVHAHPNNCCGEFVLPVGGMNIPNVIELTFLRKDRFKIGNPKEYHKPIIPHPDDVNNVRAKPPIFLNEYWLEEGRDAESKLAVLNDELAFYKKFYEANKDHERSVSIIYNMWRQQSSSGNIGESGADGLAQLTDVAEGKKFFLSSTHGSLPNKGIVSKKAPFFFHTGFGINQSITIDLKDDCVINAITIENRTDTRKQRARILFYACHGARKFDPLSGIPLNVDESFCNDAKESTTFVPGKVARYVTIFSPMNTALHLSAIRIYGTPVHPPQGV